MADSTTTPTTSPATQIAGELLTTIEATPVKPGVQTSELYVSLFAKLLGAVAAIGVLGGEAYMKITGLAVVAVVTVGYAISRGLAKGGALVLLLALGLGSSQLMACGANASQQRQTALQAALVTTDTACATFAAYNLAHQEDLKVAAHASGATNAEVTDTIAKWRAARDPALKACKTVLEAIKAGATITDDQSIKAMTAAAGILADALRILGVKL